MSGWKRWLRHRCFSKFMNAGDALPANGFYEWKGAKPPKIPHFIQMRDKKKFAFAGTWECWQNEKDETKFVTRRMLCQRDIIEQMCTSNELKTHRQRVPIWALKLSILKSTTPFKWDTSIWYEWSKRIQSSYVSANRAIHERYKKYENTQAYSELIVNDYHQNEYLTETMYAALIVAIWAEVERYLKHLLGTCYSAAYPDRHKMTEAKKFCKDFLAGKASFSDAKKGMKMFRNLCKYVPVNFDEIKEAIKLETGVAVETCSNYGAIVKSRG
jgi:hypothetical protein